MCGIFIWFITIGYLVVFMVVVVESEPVGRGTDHRGLGVATVEEQAVEHPVLHHEAAARRVLRLGEGDERHRMERQR